MSFSEQGKGVLYTVNLKHSLVCSIFRRDNVNPPNIPCVNYLDSDTVRISRIY